MHLIKYCCDLLDSSAELSTHKPWEFFYVKLILHFFFLTSSWQPESPHFSFNILECEIYLVEKIMSTMQDSLAEFSKLKMSGYFSPILPCPLVAMRTLRPIPWRYVNNKHKQTHHGVASILYFYLQANAAASLSNEEMDRLAPPAQLIDKSGSLEIIPENCSLDPSGRLSISLDDKNVSSPSSCGSPIQTCRHTQSLSRPPTASRGHHEVKSYSCLPQVRISPFFFVSYWPPKTHHMLQP